MSDAIGDYYGVLERLKRKKDKINNDTVALEAGRKKGSIKKSRPQHADLIKAIDAASRDVAAEVPSAKNVQADLRAQKKQLQTQLDDALERELSLVREVFPLKRELAALRGGSVIPIRRNSVVAPKA